MKRQTEIKSRRLEVATEAGSRWQESAPERSQTEKELASGKSVAEVNAPQRVEAFRRRENLRQRGRIATAVIPNFEKRVIGEGAAYARIPSTVSVDERQIGATLDFDDLPPNETAARVGKAVARIVEMPEGHDVILEGFGTGFLVTPRLLLTNHHVFPNKESAVGTAANFLHERTAGGLLRRGVLFELLPDVFFYSFKKLDLALVAVKPQGEGRAGGSGAEHNLADFGCIRLIPAQGKILENHPINIIQHPAGGAKKYATTNNKLVKILENGFLHYTTDTLRGSSGSPVLNVSWEAVGLHHSGVPMMKNGKILNHEGDEWDESTMGDEDIHWVANEGIRVSAIISHLASLTEGDLPRPEQFSFLRELLQNTADPLATFQPAPEKPTHNGATANGKTGAAAEETTALSILENTAKESRAVSQILINIAGNATIYVNTAPAPAVAGTAAIPSAAELTDAVKTSLPASNGRLLEARLRFDRNYNRRKGYDPEFLNGLTISLPSVAAHRQNEILTDNNGAPLVLKYHHFSLVMNKERRLQMWSAVNADYNPSRRDGRSRDDFGEDHWIPDPRIPAALQIQNDDFYRPATKIDRGHIVRREDNAWGTTAEEIEFGNSDTFHWTNCTPQHERFNQASKRGVWGKLENHIQSQINAVDNRAVIFAGPVLASDDPGHNYGHGEIQYPLKFWKVIVAVSTAFGGRRLVAYGFVLDQKDVIEAFGLERMDFGQFRTSQFSVSEITGMTGVEFPVEVLRADVLSQGSGNEHNGGGDDNSNTADLNEALRENAGGRITKTIEITNLSDVRLGNEITSEN